MAVALAAVMPIPRIGLRRSVPYQPGARHFVTCCTRNRAPFFVNELVVADAYLKLRRTLDAERFALLAYVFMPDHLHLLVEGQTTRSDLPACVNAFRQASSFAFLARHGRPLWQAGYYDHAIGGDAATAEVARYIFENPVRKGLVTRPHEYLYLGSDLGPVDGFFGSA